MTASGAVSSRRHPYEPAVRAAAAPAVRSLDHEASAAKLVAHTAHLDGDDASGVQRPAVEVVGIDSVYQLGHWHPLTGAAGEGIDYRALLGRKVDAAE